MKVHPIDWRYGSEEMRRLLSYENFIRLCAEIELVVLEEQAKAGLVPRDAPDHVRKALKALRCEDVIEEERRTKHDIFALLNVLRRLTEYAEWLHIGLTSEDVKETARVIVLREALKRIILEAAELTIALSEKAESTADLPCVGRTHGLHAAPTTMGYKLAVFAAEIARHLKRLVRAWSELDYAKLSGPVGVHTALGEIGEEIERRALGRFGLRPDKSATQLVARDRWLEVFLTLAMLSTTLERLATEIRNLSRTEISEVAEPFGEEQIGSSAMPHKQNPIMCERVSGLARVVRALALAELENTVLWHERDLSNSAAERCIIPEIFLLVDEQLRLMRRVISGLRIFEHNVRKNLEMTRGLIFDEALVTALALKGMGRMRAYHYVRKLVRQCLQTGEHLMQLALKDEVVLRYLTPEEIRRVFDVRERTRVASRRARELATEARRVAQQVIRELGEGEDKRENQ